MKQLTALGIATGLVVAAVFGSGTILSGSDSGESGEALLIDRTSPAELYREDVNSARGVVSKAHEDRLAGMYLDGIVEPPFVSSGSDQKPIRR